VHKSDTLDIGICSFGINTVFPPAWASIVLVVRSFVK
jgi:hypothetical protein